MALIKADHILERTEFVFDPDTGDVVDVILHVNMAIKDDITDVEETRVRKSVNVWVGLSSSQKTQADAIGKKLNQLAATL